MKTKLNFTIMLGVLCLSLACTKQLSETRMDEKAGMNGSFEILKDNLPVNWIVYTPNTTSNEDYSFSNEKDNPKDGKNCLVFKVLKCKNTGGWESPGIAKEIKVEKGNDYKISYWIKNKNSEYQLNINSVNEKENSQGLKIKSSETLINWTYFEHIYHVPSDMETLRIELNILKPGTLWLDDFQINKI